MYAKVNLVVFWLIAFQVAFAQASESYRTQNFVVTAATSRLAKQVGDKAEFYRSRLSDYWLGKQLPSWDQPCPITVTTGRNIGAGGATSFMFDRGVPFGWRMSIQGSAQRILDSVLPHEVTHTIFATHFGQPLPRWADEGACLTVENVTEQKRLHDMLIKFLTVPIRSIAFNEMFAMREYPADILPLYAQGHSVARFLIHQGGPRKFIKYIDDGLRSEGQSGAWTNATRENYGYRSLSELQMEWLGSVRHSVYRLGYS